MQFDLKMTDALLSTTRAVRKRLDFDRPVPRSLIEECVGLSQQAPTGSNSQGWRWILVEDSDKKMALGDIYRKMAGSYLVEQSAVSKQAGDEQTHRVMESAVYLAENLEKAPILAIPCLQGRPPEGMPVVGILGVAASIYPAVWSFQLALRARGLGSCLTSLHLLDEKKSANLLGIPDDVIQVALLPVAYTRGTDFRPAKRPEPATIMHWDQW
jgi:nitroreductase